MAKSRAHCPVQTPQQCSHAKPDLQRSLLSPHILPAPSLPRRGGGELNVRLLWKNNPVLTVMEQVQLPGGSAPPAPG